MLPKCLNVVFSSWKTGCKDTHFFNICNKKKFFEKKVWLRIKKWHEICVGNILNFKKSNRWNDYHSLQLWL